MNAGSVEYLIMAKRKVRVSPGYEDYDRLAENLMNNGYFPDDDVQFRSDMKDYFEGDIPKELMTPNARKQVLKFILFKTGGGKSLKKDQEKTSKTVYPNTPQGREDYEIASSQRADLSGVDTKQRPIRKRPKAHPKAREFTRYGVIKQRVVKVRETTITLKGKKIKRYIDKNGRFAKVTE